MITFGDIIFRGLKLVMRIDNKIRRYTCSYKFINRQNKAKELVIIVAGYQDYLWDGVFERFKKYIPKTYDVCVTSPGIYCKALAEICQNNKWSYLFIKANKLALAQNMAIKLHPAAKYIFKFDEDIFIGRKYFEDMLLVYKKIEEEKKYRMGVLSPTLNINGATYEYFLTEKGLENDYEEKFGSICVSCDRDPIYLSGKVAVYMWEKTLPLDETIEDFSAKKKDYFPVPIRLSIGAILFSRKFWDEMEGFKVAANGQLAWEEMELANYCINHSYCLLIAKNVFAGHFGFGCQKEEVLSFYKKNIRLFNDCERK